MPRRAPLAALALLGALIAARAQAAAPPPPTVQITGVTVTEGNAGLTTFKAWIALQVYGAFQPGPSSVEMDVKAMAGTANASDFVFAPVHLTVTSTPQEISGAIVGDEVFEGDETFSLVATPTSTYPYVASSPGIVTITDDDQGGAPRLSIESVTTVPEGNAGWHVISVPVRLQPAATTPVTVAYLTTSGTQAYEVNGQLIGDFRATKGTLTFEPGETVRMISVEVLGDTTWEPDTSFNLELAQPTGAVILAPYGKVVLINDDATIGVSIADMVIAEGNAGTTTVTVHIHLESPAPASSKVWFGATGGSAVEGEDFANSAFTTLYPQLGQTEITATIDIVGDTKPECDEGIIIQYRGVYLGDDREKIAHLTILDDDGGPKGSAACPALFTPLRVTPQPPETSEPDGGRGPIDDGGTPMNPAAMPDTAAPKDDPGKPTGAGADAGTSQLPDRGCAVAPRPGAPLSDLGWSLLVIAALFARRAARRC